jgi:photosystem II stability/assembly factor-like uncharacterized protein
MRRVAVGVLASAAALAIASTGWSRTGAGSVPGGFRPETAAAVGARDIWVVGDHRCGANACRALVRSTDGGKHFSRVGLPHFTTRLDPTVVFANARDGFVFVYSESPVYTTHDGGLSWQRTGPAADVDAFAASGGYAYAVFGRERFQRSRVGRNSWQKLSLPFSPAGGPLDVAAYRSHMWIVGTSPSPRPDAHSELGRSDDHGSTFVVKPSPCYPGLPGGVTPAGKGALWAVCSSGMMASLSLSTDDGRSFAIRSFHDPGGVGLPSLTNAASIAAPSARVAVLTRGAGGAFLRTTDAGRQWSLVPNTGRITGVPWMAFATHNIALAVVELRNRAALWRTTDSGATWHSIQIR